MKITLPVGDKQTLTFDGFDQLSSHYGNMANAYLKDKRERAEAYGIVAWQLAPSNGFRIQPDSPQGWEYVPQDGDLWAAYQDGKFIAGGFGSREHAEEWVDKYTNPPLKLLKISFCAADMSGEYYTEITHIAPEDLGDWIISRINHGKPLLINDCEEVDAEAI